MPELLKKLNFITLKDYLALYNISLNIPINVYIKYIKLLDNPDLTNRLSLGEILNHSIRTALNKNTWNAITAGYSLTRTNKLFCNAPNSTLNLLKTEEWKKILIKIGDELFIHILIDCVLVQIVNHNKVLLAGNILDCKDKKSKVKCISRERLLFKAKNGKIVFDSEKLINNVLFDLKNFKCENEKIEDNFTKTMSLIEKKYKKAKVNCIFKTYKFYEENEIQDIKDLEVKDNNNIQVAKDLEVKDSNNIQVIKDFEVKDNDDIKDIDCNRVESMKLNDQKPSGPNDLNKQKSNRINGNVLNDFKEQGPNRTNIVSCSAKNPSQNNKEIKPVDKKKLVDFLFCTSKKIFKDVFTLYNFRILKAKLSLFVSRNRYETLSEDELKLNFRIKQFPWGKLIKNKGDHEFVQNLTKSFLFHLFEDFFIPLISNFFYTTETGFGMREVYFYKRHLWYEYSDYHTINFLNEKCVKDLVKDLNESKNGKKLHNVRCIPKKDGARIIVNLSKGVDKSGGSNKLLYPMYSILKREVRHKLGNSALGYEDMHKMAYPFLNNFKNFYILKLDLKKCYVNIPHKYLKKLINNLYSKDYYFVKKFYTLGIIRNLLRQGRYFRVMDSNTPSDIHYKETVFSCDYIYKDESYFYFYKRENIIESLRKIALENKIYYKNESYSQNKGIPQGSVFSNILCGLYLNKIDEKYFNLIFEKGKIIRYVDDYLVLTPSLKGLKEFLNKIEKLERYGIVFNTKKIMSNFDMKTFEFKEMDEDLIWCGLKLISKDNKTGFKIDFKSKMNKYTVSYSSVNPGIDIFNKMKKFFITRTPKILFSRDNKFVYQNIFDFFILYKVRLRTLFSRAPFVNIKFYLKILDYCIEEMMTLCKERKIKISEEIIQEMSKKAFNEREYVE